MTPEEAYRLAKYQRPGVKLVVGPTEAREERVEALSLEAMWKLPGEYTWAAWDHKQKTRPDQERVSSGVWNKATTVSDTRS